MQHTVHSSKVVVVAVLYSLTFLIGKVLEIPSRTFSTCVVNVSKWEF